MTIEDIENELIDIESETEFTKEEVESITKVSNLVEELEECLSNDDIDLELDITEEILSQVISNISDGFQYIEECVSNLKDNISNIDCEQVTTIGYERQEHYIENLEEVEQEISNIDVDVECIVDNADDIKQRLDSIKKLIYDASNYNKIKKQECRVIRKKLKDQEFKKVIEQVRTVLNNNPDWGRSKVMKELNLPENQVKRALATIKGGK